MRPHTETIPKVLLPVLGRPFAELQLEWLQREGVQEVLYSIGYLGDQVRRALGDGSRFAMRITYVDEGADLRGSLGALRLALDEGVLPEAFFVLYGDSYLFVDLQAVEDRWRESRLRALMTVLRNEGRWDTSNVMLEDGRLVYDKTARLVPPERMHWIDYGLLVMQRETIATALAPHARGDLAELMREMSARGEVAAFEVTERFFEIGSPAGVGELEAYLRSRDAEL
jgi:NDP-sugar pyrophosphorylase family protein